MNKIFVVWVLYESFSLLSYTAFVIWFSFFILDFLSLLVIILKILFLKTYLFLTLAFSWFALLLCCSGLQCVLQLYSVRLFIPGFFWYSSALVNVPMNYAHENSSFWFTLPLTVLSFFSIFIGYLTKDLLLVLGSSFLISSILNLLFSCCGC